jgi:hypothetical protein
MKHYYYIRYQDRTKGGYYFMVYRDDHTTVFESATHPTREEADTIAEAVLQEFERINIV